jgi:hypothetical protein
MATPNNQLMVVPQRRSGKSEAVLRDVAKLLQEYPDMNVHIYAQNAEQAVQELPGDVQNRASCTVPLPLSNVEKLRNALRPLVRKWVAERPIAIRIPIFLHRFPILKNTPLLSKAIIPLLGEYNPEYFDSGNRGVPDMSLIMIDEWEFVPHDFTIKLVKSIVKTQ